MKRTIEFLRDSLTNVNNNMHLNAVLSLLVNYFAGRNLGTVFVYDCINTSGEH